MNLLVDSPGSQVQFTGRLGEAQLARDGFKRSRQIQWWHGVAHV